MRFASFLWGTSRSYETGPAAVRGYIDGRLKPQPSRATSLPPMTTDPVAFVPITRFAPSPTGLLQLGHAFAALIASEAAHGAPILLRIEDLDRGRVRAEYDHALREDLAWLGLRWHEPVLQQSTRADAYRAALARLEQAGLVYPCFCSRRDIVQEIARAAEAQHGPDGPLYPGTWRSLSPNT